MHKRAQPASVMWHAIPRRAFENSWPLARRHITSYATLERLCGRSHNRSITLAPRRYRDPKTGEWKDAVSYRPVDLATLELALAAARQYCASTPLPGQPLNEADEANDMHVLEDGEVIEPAPAP